MDARRDACHPPHVICGQGHRQIKAASSSISNFVQQLLAAEVFLAVGFVILLAFAGVCYLLGAMGERGWSLMKQEVQNQSAHRHGALLAHP